MRFRSWFDAEMIPVEVTRFWPDPAVCPAPLSFCWLPENLVMIQAFDLADPDFQAAFPNFTEADYAAIWASGFAVAVEWTGEGPEIRHLEDAFRPG